MHTYGQTHAHICMYILYVCALGICACTIAAATTTITVCIAIRLLHLSHALQHCGGGSKFKGKVMKENSDKIAKKKILCIMLWLYLI